MVSSYNEDQATDSAKHRTMVSTYTATEDQTMDKQRIGLSRDGIKCKYVLYKENNISMSNDMTQLTSSQETTYILIMTIVNF